MTIAVDLGRKATKQIIYCIYLVHGSIYCHHVFIVNNSICKLFWVHPVFMNRSCSFFAYWVIFHAFLSSADFFFSKSTFSKNSSRNTIRVSNSLDPDQAQQNIGLIWVQTVFKGYQQTTLGGEVKT